MGETDVCDIDKIIKMLDWNNSARIQQNGIELAKKVKYTHAFVMPMVPGKSVWENCAKILFFRTDQILNSHLFRLLEWTEDINWPGALIVLERLKNFSDMDILPFAIQESVKKASALKNSIWLSSMSQLLENDILTKKLPDYITIQLKNC